MAESVKLRVHLMFVDIIDRNRSEGSQSNVKGEVDQFYAFSFNRVAVRAEAHHSSGVSALRRYRGAAGAAGPTPPATPPVTAAHLFRRYRLCRQRSQGRRSRRSPPQQRRQRVAPVPRCRRCRRPDAAGAETLGRACRPTAIEFDVHPPASHRIDRHGGPRNPVRRSSITAAIGPWLVARPAAETLGRACRPTAIEFDVHPPASHRIDRHGGPRNSAANVSRCSTILLQAKENRFDDHQLSVR